MSLRPSPRHKSLTDVDDTENGIQGRITPEKAVVLTLSNQRTKRDISQLVSPCLYFPSPLPAPRRMFGSGTRQNSTERGIISHTVGCRLASAVIVGVMFCTALFFTYDDFDLPQKDIEVGLLHGPTDVLGLLKKNKAPTIAPNIRKENSKSTDFHTSPSPSEHENKKNREKDSTPMSAFDLYNPSKHPILDPDKVSPDKENPLPVRLFLGGSINPETERPVFQPQSTFLFDGLKRSPYIDLLNIHFVSQSGAVKSNELVNTPLIENDPQVWMVDFASLNQDCHRVERLVRNANFKNRDTWFLAIVEYSSSSTMIHCPNLEKVIPLKQIRYAKRSIVENRYWDDTKEWVQAGELVPNLGTQISAGPVLYASLVLRESFVREMNRQMGFKNEPNNSDSIATKNNPANWKRENDVTHFWPQEHYSHYGFLKRKVSEIVASLKGEKTKSGRKIHAHVHFFEHEDKDLALLDENNPDNIPRSYVKELLSTKIVVVAQRDEWEGDYQLIEALASGAMVMADSTIGLAYDLQDKKNIVLYDSAESLKSLLLEYLDNKNDANRLEVARAGYKTAMERHRSWHRIEELLFGEPLTGSNAPALDATETTRKRILGG